MKKRWLSVVSLALLFVFATAALALGSERSYGNFSSVAANYAYHKDFYGSRRTFLYNTGHLLVRYKSADGVWRTASNPAAFVRSYHGHFNSDSVYWHQSYTTKVVDQITFCNS